MKETVVMASWLLRSDKGVSFLGGLEDSPKSVI